jgi:hypothetical protein
MRERPKTIQRLYKEFEKYCRSDNDFKMCMEEQSQQKSLRKLINPARGNGPIPEMPRTPTLEAFSVWTAKTLRKTPIRRLIHRAWYLPRLVPLTPIRGGVGAEEAEAEVGVEAGAEATTRKENGIVFSTRKTMTTTQIIDQTRKDSKQSLRRKERKRRERVS